MNPIDGIQVEPSDPGAEGMLNFKEKVELNKEKRTGILPTPQSVEKRRYIYKTGENAPVIMQIFQFSECDI